MTKVYAWGQAHQDREEGQGVIEYALIVGLVSVALAVFLSGQGQTWITSAGQKVTDALAATTSTN